MQWLVRTNAIHTLHPVVKLADGNLLVGTKGISTAGEFMVVEVAFGAMQWFQLDPQKVVVLAPVQTGSRAGWTKWGWRR